MLLKRSSKYFVYILTDEDHTILQTGVTGDIIERLYQVQRQSMDNPDMGKWCTQLVYLEGVEDVRFAIIREQKIDNFSRSKKKELINHYNPGWRPLNEEVISCTMAILFLDGIHKTLG